MFRSQVCLFLLFLEQLTQAQTTPPCFAINKWTERPSQAIWNSATGVGVGSLWSEQSDTHKSAASLVPAAGSKSLIYWSHLPEPPACCHFCRQPRPLILRLRVRGRWQARRILKESHICLSLLSRLCSSCQCFCARGVCACSHESLKSWICTGSEEDKMCLWSQWWMVEGNCR